VQNDAQFAEAFKRAEASGKVSIIEVQLDEDVLSTGQSLSATRALALKG
jgi:acetolactate synthase-1/2/3 large subunit